MSFINKSYSQNDFISALLVASNYQEGEHKIKFKNNPLYYSFKVKDSIIKSDIKGYNRSGKLKEFRSVSNNEFNGLTIIYDQKGRTAFKQIVNNDTLIEEIDSSYHFLSDKLYGVWKWSRKLDSNFHLISDKNEIYFTRFWTGYGQVPAINGLTTLYYKNGNIKKIKRKTDYKRNGKWEYYRKDGSLKKTVTYEMGTKIRINNFP